VDFFVFLILNGILFIRPEELFPAIAGLQLYYWVICANLVICGGKIIYQIQPGELAKTPVTVCVLGVLATIFLSHAAKFDLWSARMGAFEFLKVALYYFLLLSVVKTRQRLLWFLAAIVVLVIITNVIAVAQYHGIVEIETLRTLMDHEIDDETGERVAVPRMVATGIFNDPNDLSMIIVAALLICSAGLFIKQLGGVRFGLFAPIAFLFYALTLTQSRGGLLALMAGCGTMFYLRYGMQKTLLLGCLGLPGLLLMGGRQTDIAGAMSGGTGHSRVTLWLEGMEMLKNSPLFGNGYKTYQDEAGLVAHNSFIHSAAELGFFGGAFFLGVMAISLATLWQLSKKREAIEDPMLNQLMPCIFSLNAAYMVSMFSLSRCYVVPTFLIVGTIVAYLRLVASPKAFALPRFDGKMVQRLVLGEVGVLFALYLFTKVSR
jgi:hypothetical protein